MATVRSRVHQRALARAAANRMRRHRATPVDEPTDVQRPAPAPELVDWPAITQRHPSWWQVERVELVDGRRRYVLIAECQTETAAFSVATRQQSQTRVHRFGDKRPPWLSFRQPRVVE